MPQYRNNYKQSQRGSATPALKVTLVIVLLISASAIGFMVIGPFLSKLGHSASVSSTTPTDQTVEENPADSERKPDESSKEKAPRVVSDDTGSLASIYIAERPGPEGNIIPRKSVEAPPSDDGSEGPTVEPPDTSQPERTTRPTVEGPKPKDTTPKNTRTTPPTANTGGATLYRVQLGIYMERSSAENVLADARAKGFDVSLIPKVTSTRTYYRVQAGAFSSRDGAESVRNDLTRSGFSPTIVEEKRE